jgi:hypothetical protein
MTISPQVDSAPTSYHISTRPTRREAVLILAHADGWLEAFADKHVDVRIAIMPAMKTPEGELAAERYVESSLPRRYRDVYWPGNRRAADMLRVVRPSDIAWREYDLDLLRAIQQLGNAQEEGRKRWML